MIDDMIRGIEEQYEVLYSDVPGSWLHDIATCHRRRPQS